MAPHASESHFTREDFEKYLSEQLDLNKVAEFRYHVQHCAACEVRLLEAVAHRLATPGTSGKSKRSEARLPSSGPGWLQTLSPLSLEKLSAKLVDTSPHGCSMIIPVPLQPGTIVSLGIGATVSVGTITHCNHTEDGEFRVGIERKSTPRQTNFASASNLR